MIPSVLSAAVTIFNVVYTNYKTAKKKQTEEERIEQQRRDEQRQYIADASQCLLRKDIIRDHEKYTGKGYCPVHIKESITREYKAYHNLGGNDVATELYHQIMDLPPSND